MILLRRLLYIAIAIALNLHSFFTMPPWQPDTWARLGQMALRDFDGIEPLAFVLFVLFGMFSVVLALLILRDGRYQRFPAWPFALSMMVLGPSMVLLYQAFRSSDAAEPRLADALTRLAESRILPTLIAAITLAALWDGRGGDVAQLWQLIQTDYLTHAMFVDELLFVALTPILVAQDARRRGRGSGWVLLACVPVVGACLYLRATGDAGAASLASASAH